MEIWKRIEEYPNYSVSTEGEVRQDKKGKLLAKEKTVHGYYRVTLCKDGKTKHCAIHRLVASAFLPNPDGLTQVNHIDEDKSNNSIGNLEWCDADYNINYGSGMKRRVETRIKNGDYVEHRCHLELDKKEYKRLWYLDNRDRILEKSRKTNKHWRLEGGKRIYY